MSGITTHVLDTALGKPGVGIKVTLDYLNGEDQWSQVSRGETNSDGRIPGFVSEETEIKKGVYRIAFDVAGYFASQNRDNFYPKAEIYFEVKNPDEHFHVPLLISGFGYSTYRGS